MKKSELEQMKQTLERKCSKLADLLRSTQARALGSIRILEQALQEDETCEETASEQVARCDQAIQRVRARLARIVDPAAVSQDQADQTVERLREQGLHLADALKQYIAEVLDEPLTTAEAGQRTARTTAVFVQEIEIIDPDTGNAVGVAMYKTAGGGMVGIDSSFLEQEVGPVYSPFDPGTLLTLDDEEASCQAAGERTILVRLTSEQQIGLEAELATLFGLQVDDVLAGDQPGEKLLTFVVGPERIEQLERIVTLLQVKKASGAIIDVTVVAEEENEEATVSLPVPAALVRAALAALEQLEREWLAHAPGDERFAVIRDVLQGKSVRRGGQLRTTPLARPTLRACVRRGEYISGTVKVQLGDIIDHDLEWLLDELSRLLTGTELLMDISYRVIGHQRDMLHLEVTGDATEVIRCGEEDELVAYRTELVVFTDEEARAIQDASALDPWLDQGVSEAEGHGFVLPANYTGELGEDVVVPVGVTGSRRIGLSIDGPVADVLPCVQAILGPQHTWRAWPNSDLALVVPDPAYADPLSDPLCAQLAEVLALTLVHTLENLRLAFVDLLQGYLFVKNEQGRFETWEMLPDGRGLDQSLTEQALVLDYQGELYAYGNTYASRAECEQAIKRTLEK